MCRTVRKSSGLQCRWVSIRYRRKVSRFGLFIRCWLQPLLKYKAISDWLQCNADFASLYRLMYWTEQDDDNLAIVQANMDGTGLHILRNKGLKHPTSIAVGYYNVYWVDSFRQRIEYINYKSDEYRHSFRHMKYNGFSPERLLLYERNLYWVARNGNSQAVFYKHEDHIGSVENYIVGNFTHVKGLAVHDEDKSSSLAMQNPCAERPPCSGICLSARINFTKFVCPIGFLPEGSDGCRGQHSQKLRFCIHTPQLFLGILQSRKSQL